ncbi:MAG: insulinase family protein [Rubrivivax sp.]|nr:insulinase family protein [Rubrivivax sp.]
MKPALMLLLALTAVAPTHAQPLPKELPPFGPDKPLPAPKIERQTLPNGLQVWVLPRQGLPRVDLVLAVKGAGYTADPADRPGLASLLAGLMTEGTKQRDAKALAEAVQALGGAIGADAGNDGLVLSANALASRGEALVKLFAEVARQPAFADNEVKLARDNALQALKAAAAQPGFLADGALAKAVYGSHPYGRTQATEASITGTTAEALRAEHARRFRPDQAVLVIAGRVAAKDAQAWAAAAFGDWKADGAAPPATPAVAAQTPPQRLLIHRAGSTQSTLRLGRPGLPVSAADDVALRVASAVIGSGFTSRINLNLREEKGYTYGAGAGGRSHAFGGGIFGGADVRNEVTGASLKEFVAEYRRLGTEPVPAAELTVAKRYLAGTYVLGVQQQGALAQRLARDWMVGLPASRLAEFVPAVHKVSAEQVREIGRRYFAPEAQSIVVVGDQAAIAEQLKPYGEFVAPAGR